MNILCLYITSIAVKINFLVCWSYLFYFWLEWPGSYFEKPPFTRASLIQTGGHEIQSWTQISATNVTLHILIQTLEKHIWKHTAEKSQCSLLISNSDWRTWDSKQWKIKWIQRVEKFKEKTRLARKKIQRVENVKFEREGGKREKIKGDKKKFSPFSPLQEVSLLSAGAGLCSGPVINQLLIMG